MIIEKQNPIHELSMALVWLYYGFAMNRISLNNEPDFLKHPNIPY